MNRVLALALVLATAGVADLGCRRGETKPEPPPAEPELAPLASPSTTVALAVADFAAAVAVVPVGATRPAPVLVAVLGIGDTPEQQCAMWNEIMGGRGFVVCPRGVPHYVVDEEQDAPAASGYFHPDLGVLEKEVDASLVALRGRFGRHVADDVTYAGFSRGAFLGASLVAKHPERYRRAIFIEGGQTAWTEEEAAFFAKGGGNRILFACGQPSRVDESNVAAALLGTHGVATRVIHGVGEGHGYQHQVKDEVRRSFDWITEGNPLYRRLL